jgi:hypothetical protein
MLYKVTLWSGKGELNAPATMEALVASGAIVRENKTTGKITVSVLEDGTAKCSHYTDAIRQEGYRWNPTWKQWGRCKFDLDESLFSLLQSGVLTVSESGGVLVVSNGFGTAYDARASISQAGFRWNKESKKYVMDNATGKQRDAVKNINEKAQPKLPTSAWGWCDAIKHCPLEDRCWVGMPPSKPYKLSTQHIIGSEEAIRRWNEFHDRCDNSSYSMYGGTPPLPLL